MDVDPKTCCTWWNHVHPSGPDLWAFKKYCNLVSYVSFSLWQTDEEVAGYAEATGESERSITQLIFVYCICVWKYLLLYCW